MNSVEKLNSILNFFLSIVSKCSVCRFIKKKTTGCYALNSVEKLLVQGSISVSVCYKINAYFAIDKFLSTVSDADCIFTK